MEVENLKAMSLRLMTSMISGGPESKDDVVRNKREGQKALGNLLSSVQSCQARYGGRTELATEDDVRVSELCERWACVLSHGLRPPPLTSAPSAIQNIVTAGINFAFNINYIGASLWNYARLHLTRHEEERFKNLKQISTSAGYFKAFLRASLNERSLERYLHSWVGHSLVTEYYEDWALMRDSEATSLLPNMAAGLVCILFALSIDKAELNETQMVNPLPPAAEPVIAVKAPVMKTNVKKKTLRQVISFDTKEENEDAQPVNDNKQFVHPVTPVLSNITATSSSWNSAPPTCVSSPDPNSVYAYSLIASQSEPTTSNYDVKRKHFFSEDSVSSEKSLNETPGQILARLSEKARDIFSSKKSLTGSQKDWDVSSASGNRLSESDSEGGPEGSVSCLELCFPEDEGDPPGGTLSRQQEETLSLQLRITQLEIAHKEKCCKMEKTIMDLNRENDRLKEQLRKYVSAVQMLKQDGSQADEVKQYEAKLVQVAEMHAELMEFNEVLQRRLLSAGPPPAPLQSGVLEGTSNLQVWIPSAFLITSGTKSFHVYQVFLKIFSEEWNVYRRYSEFRKLYSDLKNTHPDISPFKFPPKKALGKKEAWVVERRRGALAAWLRHVAFALPQLRSASTRAQLLTLLPFFGDSNGGAIPGNPLRPSPATPSRPQ